MLIRDIFEKPITRTIKGVIKVGQDDQANVEQELDEYVVTRELEKHFRTFFANYVRSIDGDTDDMGVWISGFFGSGKSHFLKILSYILGNKVVGGRRAIDYFIEDHKISDPLTLANMQRASTVSTDVILFNIDSKSEMTGKQSKDAIVSVFLRVFNEMQGFCGTNPYLADLERKLSEGGQYEAFRKRIEEKVGQPWEEVRHDFDFIQDDVVETLADIGFMSMEAARNWCEKAVGDYDISIEDFARMVKRYIDRKPKGHHVVFLVDEVGQYIGDDSRLMLNMQTITEDLGKICRGKVWIVVTSQQDIDSITKTKGNDFSKIQGRFETRISLSSANVDEVIRRRILTKTKAGESMLELLFEEQETKIKNLILFTDGAEKKLYADREDFAVTYPFVPYQFNLMASVLTAIRAHGASGKHLSDGERSMLAVFKESAEREAGSEPGVLVPFYMFYDALEKFLDHSHAGVIIKALNNDILNPEHKEECFDVNVLKTLFLIKNVKEIKATLDQITSLMITHVDEDRLGLKRKVEESLRQLIQQTLVQKNGEVYIFLTNEEQEVERWIRQESQNIEQADIIRKVSEEFFDGIYGESRYRYPAFSGRYQFAFSQKMDDRFHRTVTTTDLMLRVLTPYSDERGDDQTMRLISGQSNCVLVVLPDNRSFMDEIRNNIAIEHFLQKNVGADNPRIGEIRETKKRESQERTAEIKRQLEDALRNAAIYVGGDLVQSTTREIKARINEAMGKLVDRVYYKLTYIDTAYGEADIRDTLRPGVQQTVMVGVPSNPNQMALTDVNNFIAGNSGNHSRTSLKTVMDRFTKAPYGFIEADVQWLVAKLFRNGDINLIHRSVPITLIGKPVEEILMLLTRKANYEALMLDRREKVTEAQKKAVRTVCKGLFEVSPAGEDEDEMMAFFLQRVEELRNKLLLQQEKYNSHPRYPGKAVIQKGLQLLNNWRGMKEAIAFFRDVSARLAECDGFVEDYAEVNTFLEGIQHNAFDEAVGLMDIFHGSETYFVDTELESIARKIDDILNSPRPYGRIRDLPELIDQFRNGYTTLLDEHAEPVKQHILEARQQVEQVLKDEPYTDKRRERFGKKVTEAFDNLTEKANATNDMAKLKGCGPEADALRDRFIRDINAYVQELMKQTPHKETPETPAGSGNTIKQDPRPLHMDKRLSIRDVSSARTWDLKTPEDVDRYLEELRKKLTGLLAENTTVHIDF